MSGSPVRLPSPDLPEGPRHALVVATSRYTDPSLDQLRAPATDAAELAAVLEDPEIGGFAVTRLEDACAQDVRVAIEEFTAERSPGDTALFYISCHGVTDSRRRLHFAATDTHKSRLASTGVAAEWVQDRLTECRARRQVVILDCCFSGGFGRGAKGAEDVGLSTLMEHSGRGQATLTASSATEYSFESTADGVAHEGATQPGSVFTSALLEGLRGGGADTDGDGLITVDELYGHAFELVRARGVGQTPQRSLSGGVGHIVIARSPAGRPVVPAPLPDTLRAALESPHPQVRIGAVQELGSWLEGDDAPRSVAALSLLTRTAAEDIPRVARVAATLLGQAHTASLEPPRRPTPTDPPPADPAPADPAPADPTPADPTPAVAPEPVPAVAETLAAPRPPAPVVTGQQPTATGQVPAVIEQAPAGSGQAPLDAPARALPTTELAVLTGHQGVRLLNSKVTRVLFTPDGGTVMSCGDDGHVRVWDVATATAAGLLTLPKASSIADMCLSPDGRQLVTCGADGSLLVWDARSRQQLTTLAAKGATRAVAFSPDGARLVGGGGDGVVTSWDMGTGQSRELYSHGSFGGVLRLACSPRGDLVASVGVWGRKVMVTDATTGQDRPCLVGHTNFVYAVAFSPDGSLVATGSGDHTVRLWSTVDGSPVRVLAGSSDFIRAVAFHPTLPVLAAAGDDRRIRLWDLADGQLLHTLTGHQGWVLSVAFSPDGKLLASSATDKKVRLWH